MLVTESLCVCMYLYPYTWVPSHFVVAFTMFSDPTSTIIIRIHVLLLSTAAGRATALVALGDREVHIKGVSLHELLGTLVSPTAALNTVKIPTEKCELV